MLIGFIHLLVFFSLLFYALIASYKYDKIIFILFLLLCIHWVVLKGECLISYLYKKNKDNTYHIGKNSSEMKDIDDFSEELSRYTEIDKNKINNMIYMLIYITFIALFYRFLKHKTIKPILILYLNFIFLLMYIIYLKTNYRNNTIERLYAVFLTISILIICIVNGEKKLKLFKK
jgi:hypothetical protein